MLEELISNEEALMVVCFSAVAMAAIFVVGGGCTLFSVLKLFADTRLKQQMLDRGMSASEIEQVLKAGSDEFKSKWHQRRDQLMQKRQASLSA